LIRTADILDKYIDSRVDFVDATIVAVAERLQVSLILTLDQRDFRLVKPVHVEYFDLQPTLPG
jgi:predicted nucleic acid-binding protein